MGNELAALISELHDESDLCRNEGVNDIADLLDRAIAALSSQPAQAEPDEYQIRFCNSEGQFDGWKKCDKDFFYAHNNGKDDYAQTRVIYTHPQPDTHPSPPPATEVKGGELTTLSARIRELEGQVSTLQAKVEAGDRLRQAYDACDKDQNEETEQALLDALDAYDAPKSSDVTK